MSDLQRVGPSYGGAGTAQPFTSSVTGSQRINDAHGRFYDAALRGALYSFGISNTALVAANAIATGLTSTAQPILGLWNPSTSKTNLVVLQATLIQSTISASAVSPGGFMWLYSAGNNAISTGSTPVNQGTLLSQGSVAKAFSISTALTGLSVNLVAMRPVQVAPFNAAGAVTAVSLVQASTTDNVDGSIIVPPGGVVAIMGQASTTTMSLSTGILWEEIPAL